MHSAIYNGWLRHRRFLPRKHEFQYDVFMMYIDLQELDQVLSLSPFWSPKRWRPARFCRTDFIGDPSLGIDTAIRRKVEESTGHYPNGRICMLANFRYFGVNMNPITSYYVFDNEEKLQHIVAEVHNTPWKEKQSYVLNCNPDGKRQRIQFDKQMHVSPFNPMDMTYSWQSNTPGKWLNIHIETQRNQITEMDATLSMAREEITSASLNRTLARYPLMTCKVIAAIYWQAMKLYLKKVPIYPHPLRSKNT